MEQEWKAVEVIEKATGKTVLIKDYKFNPDLHEWGGGGGYAEPVFKKQPVKGSDKPEKVASAKDAFMALKARGYKNLVGPERKEYQRLKKLNA